MFRKDKTWHKIGMFLGIITVIIGVILFFTPADAYKTHSVEEASFGGDYYTYEYEATRIAANNAAVSANNLRELSGKVAMYTGLAFVVAGLQIFIYHGKMNFCQNIQITESNPIIFSPESGDFAETIANEEQQNEKE